MTPHQPLVMQPNLWKTFFVFLVPLIATNILQNLSGTINTIFVGQMMGVDAIAAVSVFFPILFFLLAFVIGISAGTTVLVGQAWGAQNLEKVRCVIGSTLFMTLIGGSVIAVLGVMMAEPMLKLLGTDAKVMHLSLPYVRWMLVGSPLLFVYIIYTSILRGRRQCDTADRIEPNQPDWSGGYACVAERLFWLSRPRDCCTSHRNHSGLCSRTDFSRVLSQL